MGRAIMLGTVIATLLIPSAASAAQPLKEFFPEDPATIEGVCDFPVVLYPIINRKYSKSFFDEDHNLERIIVTGRFVYNVINLDSGESFTVNASGAAFYTFAEGGYSGEGVTVRFTGRNIVWFPPGLLSSGEAYIRITSGPTTFHVDFASNEYRPLRESRRFVDVCEAFA